MEKSSRNAEVPRGGSALVRPVHPIRPWLLGLVYLAALVPLAFAPRMSGNVASRYMTIESIVERGTLTIEASPLRAGSGSPDLVRFGRHLYSDKPPVLSALGALVYAPLFEAGLKFSRSPRDFVLVNWTLVACVVGVASALTLVWLRQLLQAAPVAAWAADLLTLGFGFGSLLLSYGVTFNNHSVAAALVTGGLALVALEEPASRGHGRRRFLAGLLAGLAAAIDLPAGGMLTAVLFVWLAARVRNVPWNFVAGAAGPLLLHCALQSLVTGTPLPVEMYPEAFNYPGSYWTTAAGAWKEPGPRWQFGLELLVGPQGWLTVSPVLVFGLVGIAGTLARKGDPLRPLAAALAVMVVVLLGYYVFGVRRTDYAGQSFGTRHMLAVTPPCFFFAVVALGRLRNKLACLVFALLMAVGVVYALAGMRDPWSRIERRAPTVPALRMLQHLVLYPWSSYDR
jgi:hypothetical protein